MVQKRRKMDKPYFAMVYSQDGKTAMPIIDSEDENFERVMFWASAYEANKAMLEHHFAKSFGYAIFSMEESL